MKQKLLLLGTTLMMTLLLYTVPAFGGQATGRLDGLAEDGAYGWAYDSSAPKTPATVEVVVSNPGTGQKVADLSTTASIYREDLATYGQGSGNYGFRIAIDWGSIPEGTYQIDAYANGTKLSNSIAYTKSPETVSSGKSQDASGQASGRKDAAGQTASTGTASAETTSAGTASAGTASAETASAQAAPAPDSSAQAQGQQAATQVAGHALRPLGMFQTTAYCPCRSCSGGWGRQTCTGATARANHTIAVDPKVIPFGTKLMINGIIYTAEDRGSAVKGKHIDIFFNTHPETIRYGTRSEEVYLVQP